MPIIAIIMAAAAVLTIVVLAIIYYDDIIKWFQDRNDIKEADKDNIAFTIKQKLESGDYKVVQGIFNKRTNTVVDGHTMRAKQLDAELRKRHRGKMVVYE